MKERIHFYQQLSANHLQLRDSGDQWRLAKLMERAEQLRKREKNNRSQTQQPAKA